MSFYVYLHDESPDGVHVDFIKMAGAQTPEEAKSMFISYLCEQATEYAGEDDPDGQIEYIRDTIRWWKDVRLIKIDHTEKICGFSLLDSINDILLPKAKAVRESRERAQYEILKAKYGA